MTHLRFTKTWGTCLLLYAAAGAAESITVENAFYFRELRSPNSVGVASGDRLVYGANSVVPNGDDGTTATRAFGNNPANPLPFNPRTVNPNQFSGSVAYTQGRANNPLNLVFSNGPDSTTVTVDPVGMAGSMPTVRGLRMSGSGTDLSFSWNNPSPVNVSLERIAIRVFDLSSFNVAGNADVIHAAFLAPSVASYSLPGSLSSGLSLQLGHRYAVGIRLEDLRAGVDPNLGAPARLTSSETYFNFTPTSATLPPDVFLPIVVPRDPVTGEAGRFIFDMPVQPGVPFRLDPPVAVGYDFAIGAGDPNFASVTLPAGIGDGSYQLLVWNGTDYEIVEANLLGGATHAFGPDGVDRFRVLGIEPSAGLDPTDALAFITEVTFTGTGNFTGSMTPIVLIPEPETYTLMLAGMALVAFAARRSRWIRSAP